MAKLDPKEVEVVTTAVAACAEEQTDQLRGRKFVTKLLDMIHKEIGNNTPIYTILTSLWVVIHTIAEEWRNSNEPARS